MKDQDYDKILYSLDKRYRYKKWVNLIRSLAIIILGTSSFAYGLRLEPSISILRWMTVDGTLFTTILSFVCMIVNVVEIITNKELTYVWIYYIRLSMAVAESVIFTVVIVSQLPIFSEHLPMFDRYDSFVMHILIPLIAIASFLYNDSPIGKLSLVERFHGTWFITFYAVTIILLIEIDRLPSRMIPYFFLDYHNNPWWLTAITFIFIYGCAYLGGWILSELNRKLSWIWFRNIAR